MTSPLDRARRAYARQEWRRASECFAAAADETRLGPDDHEHFAVAAYLLGDDAVSEREWAEAYRCAADAGDVDGAARCCVLLALGLLLRAQTASAGGWLAHADSLVETSPSEGAAAGYTMVRRVLGALHAGDARAARDLAERATALGRRFGDADLRTLGLLGNGQSLIALGDSGGGVARLDEAMVGVTAGEVGPVVSGIVYCAVIVECLGLFDVSRAAEWTDALTRWCDAQPDLVPFRGQCLVHRSQLQQLTGHWSDAVATVADARLRLAEPLHPALGLACYHEAELSRLRGDFDRAEGAYRTASRHGHHPMPGLALLELARGEVAAAAAAIRLALHETGRRSERPSVLAAAVDILREVADVIGARAAADELAAVAAAVPDSPLLQAMAAYTAGTVLLAEGDPVAALGDLREAASGWRALRMPYEGARTSAALSLACLALGDRTGAALELDNATAAFTELGAGPDLARLGRLSTMTNAAPPGPLSAHEREVLAHLAAGETNRQIADALTISPHTVARHVENIFTKLGVGNRAAATAYAYEHGLLAR